MTLRRLPRPDTQLHMPSPPRSRSPLPLPSPCRDSQRPAADVTSDFLAGKLQFACPAHQCQSCHLGSDHGTLRLARCWQCPRVYHIGWVWGLGVGVVQGEGVLACATTLGFPRWLLCVLRLQDQRERRLLPLTTHSPLTTAQR